VRSQTITFKRARPMRAALTPPEIALGVQLKGRKLGGLHIRRQCPSGPYILDFYCSAARLAIEIDGYSHGVGDAPAHDARRDAWLLSQGVETLRLSADNVMDDMTAVLATILAAVRRHAPSVSFADSSPARGRS
jgi:very-short-patch-repair endonuclease